jgi:CelD/BcsL family acetyltransferase involved in cellulose biosynthesis
VAEWRFELTPVADLEGLAGRWRELEGRAESSFFQSWGWVGSWLRTLPPEARPLVLMGWDGDRLVALAALGRAAERRRGVVRSRTLRVSETGQPALDTLTVEHNGLLLEAGREAEVLARLLPVLTRQGLPWDELVVSGLDAAALPRYREAARGAGLWPRVRLSRPGFFVDLEAVRAEGGDFLATLGASARQQIRQSLRGYARSGPITLREAGSPEEALAFLEALRELHQRRWEARGQPGAFGSEFARAFHQALIRECLPRGEVQLAAVFAGDAPLGYVYNFRYRGAVSNYQGGFVYGPEPWRRPGLVAHALLVQQALERGLRRYDLLMGDQRYKRSLAREREEMVWLRIQRPRLRFALEQAAVTCVDVWRSLRPWSGGESG